MRQLKIGGRIITDNDCFVIAEIGSNHMGDMALAEEMIIEAAYCGADAVKFQVRDNAEMFTKTLLNSPYNNELSYGKTYGEHRWYLDWFGKKELQELQAVADKHGVLFFATPFEQKSADMLKSLDVPLYKIASCDVTNIPLVQYVARFGEPMIISTGGATIEEIVELHDAVRPINSNYAFLHCISLYPNVDEVLNLKIVEYLKWAFPENLIGFSSHHPGLLPLYVARSFGASVFEVHFTMSRGNRGTDHGFSLEPQGLKKLCDDLPRIGVMAGDCEKTLQPGEKEGFIKKFGKGIYLKRPLLAGSVLNSECICIKSPAGGLKPHESGEIIGKILINDTATGESLERRDFD